MFCTRYVLVTNYKQPLPCHHLARWKYRPAENQVIEFNRATVNRGRINLGKTHTVLQSIFTAPITSGIPSIWRKSVLIVARRSLAYCSPGVTANRGDSILIFIVLSSPFTIAGRHDSLINDWSRRGPSELPTPLKVQDPSSRQGRTRETSHQYPPVSRTWT